MMITKGLYYNTLFTVDQLCATAEKIEVESISITINIKREKTLYKMSEESNGSRDFSLSNTSNVRSISFVTKSGNDYNILEKVWNLERSPQISIGYWTGTNCLLHQYTCIYVYIELFSTPLKEFEVELAFQNVYFDIPNYTLIPYHQRVDDEYCILYTKSDVSKKRYEDTKVGIVNSKAVSELCNRVLSNS